jgi:hypothetical protein
MKESLLNLYLIIGYSHITLDKGLEKLIYSAALFGGNG